MKSDNERTPAEPTRTPSPFSSAGLRAAWMTPEAPPADPQEEAGPDASAWPGWTDEGYWTPTDFEPSAEDRLAWALMTEPD